MDVYSRINWPQVARAVWEEGFAVFPVDQSLVEPARTGFKQFLKRRDE